MAEDIIKEPIATKIPFSKKISLAARESRNASRASRMRTKTRFSGIMSRIMINLLQLISILGICFVIAFIATEGHIVNAFVMGTVSQPLNNTSSSNNNTNSSGNSSTASNDNSDNTNSGVDADSSQDPAEDESEMVVKITNELLSMKGVSKFSDILDQNDLTSKIKQITEKSAGKIVVKLSSKYKDVSRPAVRELAKTLLVDLSAKFTDLTQVTVCTSENYFVEVANRAN